MFSCCLSPQSANNPSLNIQFWPVSITFKQSVVKNHLWIISNKKQPYLNWIEFLSNFNHWHCIATNHIDYYRILIMNIAMQTRHQLEKQLDWENSHLYSKLGLRSLYKWFLKYFWYYFSLQETNNLKSLSSHKILKCIPDKFLLI